MFNPRDFLGVQIKKTKSGVKLYQQTYVTDLLNKYRMEEAKLSAVPMLPSEMNKTSDESDRENNFPFREAIGSLLYVANKTRPDIAYAINRLSRKVETPTVSDVQKLKRVLKYLKGSDNLGLEYKKGNDINVLNVFCDSDYAGDVETRKSTTGYTILFGGAPISWCSRKQSIVALSSTKAEFIAAAECCKETLYLKNLIEELCGHKADVILNIDNQSAIRLIETRKLNRRSKHIDVRYHFICEKVYKGLLKLVYCPSELQTADIFTKPLNLDKFVTHRKNLLD